MNEYKNKNEAILTGKIYRNQLVPTKSGASFVSGSMMTSRKDKKTDQWLNSYFNVKFFGDVALNVSLIPEKSKIEVKGKMTTDEYTCKKTGEKRQSFSILAFSFILVDQAKEEAVKKQQDAISYQVDIDTTVDDIPF